MRLDLFLKTGRLVKRRTVARTMCEDGRVLVNGRAAKPSREIGPGDAITLKFSSRIFELEVLAEPGAASGNDPPEAFRITSETRLPKEKDTWNENPS